MARDQGTRWTVLTALGALAWMVLATLPDAALAAGSVSTVSPRPMGMGGAFLAVVDGFASMSWNPAGLAVPACRRGLRSAVHLNVLGAAAIARETGLLTGVESDEYGKLPGLERAFIAVGSVTKAVVFRRDSVCAGALLLEEGLDPEALAESRGLADASDLLSNYYTCVAVSFRLAPSVAIGASHTTFAGVDARGDRVYGTGRAYGALLRPNARAAVGLVYFDASPGFETIRRDIEGLGPRTMNAGVSYAALPELLLTLDLRDLSERWPETALMPRAGLEWRPRGAVSLRAGAAAEDGWETGVLTLGVGLIAMEGCREAGIPSGSEHVVSYAALLSSGQPPRHLLCALVHF